MDKKILEPIINEVHKLEARIKFLEGKVFYNSIYKKAQEDLLEEFQKPQEIKANALEDLNRIHNEDGDVR